MGTCKAPIIILIEYFINKLNLERAVQTHTYQTNSRRQINKIFSSSPLQQWKINKQIIPNVHSKNCWVENNPIWVILVTQRWVILTQPFGLLCLTQQAGLLFYGLKLLHC